VPTDKRHPAGSNEAGADDDVPSDPLIGEPDEDTADTAAASALARAREAARGQGFSAG